MLRKKLFTGVILSFFLFIGAPNLSAQIYGTGFGTLLGNPSGATMKVFLTERDAFEGIIATSWRGVSATALYELHFTFPNPRFRNTHWYLGAGAHAGRWDNTAPFYDGPENITPLGISLVAGIESTFGNYPFTFGFHVMPSLNITGHFSPNIFQAGITGRYIF